jgi:hypothetical protein
MHGDEEAAMSIAMHIVNTTRGDARKAYEDSWRLMDERGIDSHPAGQQYHAAWLVGDELHVVNVWDSQEDADAFMRQVGPILNEVGMIFAGSPPKAGELLKVVQPVEVSL